MLISCDSIIPDEYDSDKTFKINAVDQMACDILSLPLDSMDVMSVERNTVSLSSLVDSATFASMSEGEIIASRYDDILAGTMSINSDSLVQISIPTGESVSYASINTSSDLVAFITHDNEEYVEGLSNEDVYIVMDIVNRDSTYQKKNSDMEIPSIACFTTYDLSTRSEPVVTSAIKARYAFSAQSGDYLVRFRVSEPENLSTFRVLLHFPK
ncbi:MAG: hypothetical protein HND50_05145 [Calditrichaeota bacterium]|nr:hypothetical protein [Calditrichota bacterium]